MKLSRRARNSDPLPRQLLVNGTPSPDMMVKQVVTDEVGQLSELLMPTRKTMPIDHTPQLATDSMRLVQAMVREELKQSAKRSHVCLENVFNLTLDNVLQDAEDRLDQLEERMARLQSSAKKCKSVHFEV